MASANGMQKILGDSRKEFRQFRTLVGMLLSDSLKLSFDTKAARKASLLRIISALVVFALLCALGVVLYSLASVFSIFSLLRFIPEAVPSFLANVVLVVALFNSIFGLVQMLYFSPDNRLMITYPCKGSTVFLARLFVFYLNEFGRLFLALTPILLSYLIFSSFPWYSYLYYLVTLLLVSGLIVLLAAFLSIPGYYVRLFLKRNSLVGFVVYTLLFALFIALIAWVIGLIPNKIDIFTNFGPYFSEIQSLMKLYRDNLPLFYGLTKAMIGSFDGFIVTPFSTTSGLYLLVILGFLLLLFVFARFVTNRLYLHLASSSFEYESVGSLTSRYMKKRPFWISQLDKEWTLLLKSPDTLASFLGAFVFLPIAMSLINKIFGAMDTTVLGNMYISAVNLALILLVSLSSNETIAHLYSEEGSAFNLNRSYPKGNSFILLSKLFLPALLGVISISLCSVYYGQINAFKLDSNGESWVKGNMVAALAIAASCFYLGHLLFAAGLDFCGVKSNFSGQAKATTNERDVVITAFVLSLSQGYLFYLFMKDGLESAYLKIMIVGLIYFALNVVLFIRKSKYLYGRGE
jgi:hypothetical protein